MGVRPSNDLLDKKGNPQIERFQSADFFAFGTGQQNLKGDHMTSGNVFPFSAIVGQENLKLCLILNAINPGIGGVLIRGEKGTAKSTTVRGLADILPQPSSLVTLPLNATEDRVAGGMDFNRAIKEGKKVLQPGVLADAHQGILYVDEINLLDDHIVDIILDAAASGINRVEREGISFCHPASFMLVGTMNPEEGDLRPQLLDRFGLCVEVVSEKEPERRVELMEQREAYDRNPVQYRSAHTKENQALAETIQQARQLLPRVKITKPSRAFIAELCATNNVAGHRADIHLEQAAKTHAAMLGQTEVSLDDIGSVAGFVLFHRKRDAAPPPPPPPPESPNTDQDPQDPQESEDPPEQTGEDHSDPPDPPGQPGRDDPDQQSQDPEPPDAGQDTPHEAGGDQNQQDPEQVFGIGPSFQVKKISSPKDRKVRRGSGRRSRSRVSQKQGRYVKSTMKRVNNDVALDATLRAAAPFQATRTIPQGLRVCLKPEDIREKIREKRMGNFLVFLVDASGSMGARGRMAASKGAILSLLLDAYQKRDRVAMVSFRKSEAWVNLPPTSSIELAAANLKEMPVGGRTPLSAGLEKTHQLVSNALNRDPGTRPIVLVITDGKSNVALGKKRPVDEALLFASKMGEDDRVKYIVVDTESQGIVTFGLAGKLAAAFGAECCKIDDLKAEALVELARVSA
jgi:magnesium chelatase subunit D